MEEREGKPNCLNPSFAHPVSDYPPYNYYRTENQREIKYGGKIIDNIKGSYDSCSIIGLT